MRFSALAPLILGILLVLAGCNDSQPQRYIDKRYLFSFIPPKGWTLKQDASASCLASVTATNGKCSLYVCVSERPSEFLPTSSDFANCELVKIYVADKLKGYNIQCNPTRLQGRHAYDAIYLRNVADENGRTRLQLVRQTFVSRGNLLYTLTSYVFGNSAAELKAAATPCDKDIIRSVSTFFLHQPPSTQK